MLILKCTQKVRDYLLLSPTELSDQVEHSASVLGDWYVNLLVIERRKCLLFVNERTLLSFIVIGLKKSKGLKHDLHQVFIHHLFNLYKLLDLPLSGLNQVMDDYFEYGYSKTDSRKLLGNMNDLAHLYQAIIAYNGGLDVCDLSKIILTINHTPQSNLNHEFSLDVAKSLLLNQSGLN